MQLLASEFAERAERTPGDVAVIDALGVHTVGEVMAAARDARDRTRGVTRRFADGPGPGRQHLADPGDGARRGAAGRHGGGAQQPRRGGGVRAGDGGHRAGCRGGLRRRTGALGGLERGVPRQAGGPRRLGARHVRPAGQRRRPLGRWCRGRDDLRLDRPRRSASCSPRSRCGTPAGRRSTRSGSRRATPSGRSSRCRRWRRSASGCTCPAMLGGPMVCIETWRPDDALEAMAAHDVRWTMLVPTMALQLSVRPTAQGQARRA